MYISDVLPIRDVWNDQARFGRPTERVGLNRRIFYSFPNIQLIGSGGWAGSRAGGSGLRGLGAVLAETFIAARPRRISIACPVKRAGGTYDRQGIGTGLVVAVAGGPPPQCRPLSSSRPLGGRPGCVSAAEVAPGNSGLPPTRASGFAHPAVYNRRPCGPENPPPHPTPDRPLPHQARQVPSHAHPVPSTASAIHDRFINSSLYIVRSALAHF